MLRASGAGMIDHMRGWTHPLVALSALALMAGCSTDAPPRRSPSPGLDAGSAKDAASADESDRAPASQTSSPPVTPSMPSSGSMDFPSNYDPCTTDDECLRRLRSSANSQARGFDMGTLVGAECRSEDNTCGHTPVCHCVYAAGEEDGAFSFGSEQDCYYYDRTGSCLISSTDFAGCDPGDLCSCVDQCQRALTTTRREEARVLDVEARHAECTNEQCRVVLRVGDRCFADFTPRPGGSSYDCSLSDDEILEMEEAMLPDGGRSTDCFFGCSRYSDCGFGALSPPTFYAECSWSMTCEDGVCGTPVCDTDADSGVIECAYHPDE